MTYLVNQTNGTLLATVLDGAVDRTHAGIALIGKKVTNYGEIQCENFVRITENFSSATSPANPLEGQLWWNSDTHVLKVFDGSVWQVVGPLTTVTNSDTATTATTALHANIADLATAANTAITSNTATTADTATNALSLGGIPASQYMLVAPPTSTTPTEFPSSGLVVGSIAIKDENGTAIIENKVSTDILFRANVNATSTDVLQISSTNLLPITNGGSNLGSVDLKFNSVYSNNFVGTSTSSKYADLAENYLADAEYDEGTVLVVGGEKEVTQSMTGKRAIGVVSTKPAYLMNSELENGTCVALKGRVPVKVIGPITKGDFVRSSDNGCAVKAIDNSAGFAVALETNTADELKLVECLVL